MPSQQNINSKTISKKNVIEKLTAIVALINFGLVIFNLSYLPNRDFYWQFAPTLTNFYDPIKGIETSVETLNYLSTVDKLDMQIRQTEARYFK